MKNLIVNYSMMSHHFWYKLYIVQPFLWRNLELHWSNHQHHRQVLLKLYHIPLRFHLLVRRHYKLQLKGIYVCYSVKDIFQLLYHRH